MSNGPVAMTLACGPHRLPLDRPRIMGVLNVTPDSFSDGGRFASPARALGRAGAMRDDGADLIDIGGESTRPGAAPVSEEEELKRVMPVLEALMRDESLRKVPLSIDTSKPAVMRAAVAAGIAMINDVTSLRAPGALEVVAQSDVAVCLMHMQGEPASMQLAPVYADVVGEVRAFLAERVQACLQAGIGPDRIVVDPGFGFGKTRAHNLALLRGLPALAQLGFPVLCGLSRKNVIGSVGKRDPSDRLAASLAAGLAAVARGASLLRVHDVRETAEGLQVWTSAMTPLG